MATLMVGVLPAMPAHADPTAADVQKQIDAAWQKLEPVIEQYNNVRSQLEKNQKRYAELSRRIEPLRKAIEITTGNVQGIAVTRYMGGRASTLNALLTSGSPTEFVDQLALLDRVAEAEQAQITSLRTQQAEFDAEQAKINALIATQQRQQAELAAKKKVIEAEITRLETLRKKVAATEAAAAKKAAEDAAAARAAAAAEAAKAAAAADAPTDTTTTATTTPTGSTSPIRSSSSLFIGGQCPAVPSTAAGGVAAKTACLQIGDPYVWGADGPGSFDCSGLTQYAWASAGVSLDHFTGAQWNDGVPVSRDNLRTGDLVFFYSDLHHVGIYVGNGLFVHAPHTGDVVRMGRLADMPYAGARRPG